MESNSIKGAELNQVWESATDRIIANLADTVRIDASRMFRTNCCQTTQYNWLWCTVCFKFSFWIFCDFNVFLHQWSWAGRCVRPSLSFQKEQRQTKGLQIFQLGRKELTRKWKSEWIVSQYPSMPLIVNHSQKRWCLHQIMFQVYISRISRWEKDWIWTKPLHFKGRSKGCALSLFVESCVDPEFIFFWSIYQIVFQVYISRIQVM